jgi:hypothetical protein
MAARGNNSRLLLDTVEELIAELPARVRGTRTRFSEGALAVLRSITDELEELELRVAQLEHRLRLLEGGSDLPPAA